MGPADISAKPENVSRNAFRARTSAARIDWIDGAARLVAALTLAATAALVAPRLAPIVGSAAVHAPYLFAVALTAFAVGPACGLATLGASAAMIVFAVVSAAGGTLGSREALAILAFIATALPIVAAAALYPRARARPRAAGRDRHDACEGRAHSRTRLIDEQDWQASALAAIGEAVVASDAEARIRFVNASAQRLVGLGAADMVGRPVEEIVKLASAHAQAELSFALRDAVARGRALEAAGPELLAAADGVRRNVLVAVAPVVSHAGARLGAVVVLRDAGRAVRSERARARLAMLLHQAEAVAHGNARSLELAERKFAAFMERLPFPAWIASDSGRTIFVNQAGQRAGGWREAIVREQTSGGDLPDPPLDARRYVAIRFPIRANGREWTGGIALDVTEAARAQRALRERGDEFDALVSQLPLPVWIARGAAPATPANAAARTFDAATCEPAIRECFATLRTACIVAHAGARTLAVTAIPIVDGEGETRGALAFAEERAVTPSPPPELHAKNLN